MEKYYVPKIGAREKSVSITIDTASKMSTDMDDVKNVGYGVLKELYRPGLQHL